MSEKTRDPSAEQSLHPHRRQVLQLGAAAGALAAAQNGCAMLGSVPLPSAALPASVLDRAELKAFCRELDGALAALSQAKSIMHVVPNAQPQDPEWRAAAAEVDRLGRQTLRSLTFGGMVGSLAPENQRDPLIARRLEKMQPELDAAVFEMTGVMASTTAEQRRAIKKTLADDPKFGAKLAAFFDAPAKDLGVPRAKRKQMRRAIDNVVWRLRKQSPDAVFDEYVGRVQKVASRVGQTEELNRQMASAAMRSMIWNSHHTVGSADAKGGAVAPSPAPAPAPQPLEPEKRTAARGGLTRKGKLITSGGILLGIGVAWIGINLAAMAAVDSFAALVMLTPASIIGFAGLVVLIIGLAWKGKMHHSAKGGGGNKDRDGSWDSAPPAPPAPRRKPSPVPSDIPL